MQLLSYLFTYLFVYMSVNLRNHRTLKTHMNDITNRNRSGHINGSSIDIDLKLQTHRHTDIHTFSTLVLNHPIFASDFDPLPRFNALQPDSTVMQNWSCKSSWVLSSDQIGQIFEMYSEAPILDWNPPVFFFRWNMCLLVLNAGNFREWSISSPVMSSSQQPPATHPATRGSPPSSSSAASSSSCNAWNRARRSRRTAMRCPMGATASPR